MQMQLKNQAENMAAVLKKVEERLGHLEDHGTLESGLNWNGSGEQITGQSTSCPPVGPPSDGDSSMHEEVGDDSMHEEVGDDSMHEHEGGSSVDEGDCYDQYDQEEYDYPDDYGPFEDNEYGYGYV
jgi:hypothetical protein